MKSVQFQQQRKLKDVKLGDSVTKQELANLSSTGSQRFQAIMAIVDRKSVVFSNDLKLVIAKELESFVDEIVKDAIAFEQQNS